MKRTTLAALAITAAAALTIITAPTAATATEIPQCERGKVEATWLGAGQFTAQTINGGPECGIWLESYTFDDHQPTSTGDYSHPQTAVEWAWAHVTAEPQTFGVAVPECVTYQADAQLGGLRFNLPNGDLGLDWIAGGVVLQSCETVEPPVVVPPVEPPVVVPPVEPPVIVTPPSEPPVVVPPIVEPPVVAAPPIVTPPVVEAPVIEAPVVEQPAEQPSLRISSVVPVERPIVPQAIEQPEALAFTGAESNGPLSLVAGGLTAGGIALAVGARLYRRRMDKRAAA
jgi:hypothetical protein